MSVRYYIFANPQDVQVLKNKLIKRGYKLHEKGSEISRHFHMNGLTLYLENEGRGGLTRNIVEFEDEEGDINQLEKIVKELKAKEVVDTFMKKVF